MRNGCAFATIVFLATGVVGAADAPRLAKVAAVQNVVESRRAGGADWDKAALDQALFANDRLRTGAGSRAAVLYADDTLHRLSEKSEVEVVPPSGSSPGLLKVLTGKHYFASRKPTDFRRVETATVTAAIKGTEFAVDVADDGTTTVTMIEGVVVASNALGSVEVGAGERATAEPGKAPVKSVVVRPRDAVAWALYYPQLPGISDPATARAAEQLSAGLVDEAAKSIDALRTSRPQDATVLSLASVMALVGDRKDEARKLADEAVRADPSSVAAAFAASFVAQAGFDLDRAAQEAERAAALGPDDPAALARVAELRMGQGDLPGARRAAEAALERAPDDARALTVLGFVELASLRSARASKLFERAVRADSGYATAQLGLGIATLRTGDPVAGRERIQAAVALDPSNSLLRSYLGKAWYEEKRAMEAGKELDEAKKLDPNDPTPWLYSAILNQNENKPVEALDDLQKSIELNDNRAVYRSRLLLDEDKAVRGADLARIFNDLGFEEAGLVAARRSVDRDPANHSGHLFLAGNYRNVPRFASAFLSEVLQARIFQPLSVNAARPDVVNASASFNEYTSLFDRPRERVFGVLAYGTTDTDLSAYDTGDVCDGVPCYKLSENEDSNIERASATFTSNGDRYAAALSYSTNQDDGFRLNGDEKTNVARGFLQVGVTERDSVQLNVIAGDRNTGDLPFRQILPAITNERFATDETNIGLGWHRKLAPGSDLAVSAIYNKTEQTGLDFFRTPRARATLEGPQVEGQWVKRAGRATWIVGGGGFDGTVELRDFEGNVLEADDQFANAYGYAKFGGLGPFEVTAGASVEKADVPVGLIPPRDSIIFPNSLAYDKTTASPKVGATATFGSGTTLRAAAYRRLAPFLGRLQTLEPTQVAGFNQFYEDPGGTRSWNYGVGVDQSLWRRTFVGASWLRRDLDVPEGFCATPDEFSGCGFQQATQIENREDTEEYTNAYVSAAPFRWMAANLAWDLEDRELESTNATPTGGFQDRIRTQRLTPELRFFCPVGVFVRMAGTRYNQEVDQFDSYAETERTRVESDFWVVDAAVGYRFPKRWGSFVLDGRNLLNKKFVFYERSIQETVVPARAVVARLEITY
ncbi:MAG TPA: tetratricopeptide repeat protein [Candidatus Polarisedimenticolaceae bacterium]